MIRLNRRTGFSLVLAGAIGAVFFWATDPHSPLGRWFAGDGIEAANHARIGSLVGIGGCAVAFLMGLWLLTRRTV